MIDLKRWFPKQFNSYNVQLYEWLNILQEGRNYHWSDSNLFTLELLKNIFLIKNYYSPQVSKILTKINYWDQLQRSITEQTVDKDIIAAIHGDGEM